jgi:hypothetical protein
MNGITPNPPPAPAVAAVELVYDVRYALAASRATRRAAAGRMRTAALMALVVSACAVGYAWISGTGPAEGSDPRKQATALILILAVVPPFATQLIVRRAWASDPLRGSRVRYELREDGLRIVGPASDVLVSFDAFVRGRRDDRGLTLLLNRTGVGVWLPAGAFDSPAAFAAAGELCARRVANFA